jgi:ribosomal protein S27AE
MTFGTTEGILVATKADVRTRSRLERQLAKAGNARLRLPDRKRAARMAAGHAEKLGLLSRPKQCEACGAGGRLTRHHPDHSRPLDVHYLCGRCHWRADGLEGERNP